MTNPIQKPLIQVLWFKKDLRLFDHTPLKEAIEQNLPLLLIYIFEPSLQKYPDWNIRHWQFIYQSIRQMNEKLKDFNAQIHCFYAETLPVFEHIFEEFDIKAVFSHQETGIRLTYDRDLQMQSFFKKNQITWKEYQNNGIIRGQKDRSIWDKAWINYVESPIQNPNLTNLIPADFQVSVPFYFDYSLKKDLDNYPTQFQPAGEKYAWAYLKNFVEKRAENYTKNISKPEPSRFSCSRLSPYLTWGNLSTRQVYQFYSRYLLISPFKRQLQNFRSRLQWRCHFIQKFEMEDRMEFEHLNRGYVHLYQPIDENLVKAWENAQTGYPFVDACMLCIKATGYLNFRMRAMLVSFLTHLLWQPWQAGVYFLAGQFLDYEPGIHFSQFQMQAGVWGTNTIRIYNPIKQSLEHDKDAVFIKKWLPALANLPTALAHQPWKMTDIEKVMYHCEIDKDYPAPIIDLKKATEKAARTLWGMRKATEVVGENQRILKKHVKPKVK